MLRFARYAVWTSLIALCSQAAAEKKSTDARLAPEDFAILPWSWTPNDKAKLEDIYNCGFNLAGFVAPDSLDTVAAAGLKGIVSDGSIHAGDETAKFDDAEITKRVRAAVERVKKHPAVYGYYLRDEPAANMFPTLAKWAAAVREAAPDAKAYLNLFPIYASGPQLSTGSYEQYVDDFVKMVKPQFISYDNYSLMDDGSLRDGYFQNLEVVRTVALRHKLPFWNIVLSNSHFHYAEPTEANLRFQAYTSLAYGVRGISYFTYFTPQSGNYRLAPIDQFGDKTPTWDMLRRVNLQIHRLGPTYLKLQSVNVFHHPDVPNGCQGLATSKFLSEVSGDGKYVVGEFEGPEGQPFILIVNKDLHRSASFGVKFKKTGQVLMTNAYSGHTGPWVGENVFLAAGQGILLSLKP